MLGKSARHAVVLAFVAVACAHNVSQDAATGADGRFKGARNINLENGEGKANGIVTYPGGDRVDWKLVELPARGQLDIKLQWVPPRPGLQLAFDVFDEYFAQVAQSKKIGKKSGSRMRTATLEGAPKGKYYIRVYAVGRGDAGMPEIEAVCDEFQFDIKNPACRNVCPQSGAPPNWPPCRNVCPDPPDPQKPACWDKVCPNPPTAKAKACKLKDFPPCDPKSPDPDNLKCGPKHDPVVATVISNEVQGGDVIITVSMGSDSGVEKSWHGQVLRGNSDSPLDGGDVQIIRVDNKRTLGRVHLTVDVLSRNPKVKLSP